MPPVVTGAVVAVIGLNLAPTACRSVGPTGLRRLDGRRHLHAGVGGVAVWTRGFIQKLLILIGLADRVLHLRGARQRLRHGQADRLLDHLQRPPWFGVPTDFTRRSSRNVTAIALIDPVVIIVVAENLGHVKAVTAMDGPQP